MPKPISSIVLIEPDVSALEKLVNFLNEKEMQAHPAENLREARKIIRNNRIDGIVVDTGIGKTDFDRLMQWIREEEMMFGIAVLLTTPTGDNKDIVQEALKWNIDGCIQKPFTFEGFFDKLAKVVSSAYRLQKISKERKTMEEGLKKQKETQEIVIQKLRTEKTKRKNKIVELQKDIKKLDIFVSSEKYGNRKEKTVIESKLYRLRLSVEQLRKSIKAIEDKMQDVYKVLNDHSSKQAEKINKISQVANYLSKKK